MRYSGRGKAKFQGRVFAFLPAGDLTTNGAIAYVVHRLLKHVNLLNCLVVLLFKLIDARFGIRLSFSQLSNVILHSTLSLLQKDLGIN